MRYVDSVTATALLQALLLTDCPALAQDYSHVCATSSSYTAGAEFETGTTCDQKMASNTAAGQALAGKDFSSAFDCSSETQTNIDIVDGIAAKCCGSCGTSTCGGSAGVLSVNYSAAVCKDKSSCACRVAVVMSFISHNYSPT